MYSDESNLKELRTLNTDEIMPKTVYKVKVQGPRTRGGWGGQGHPRNFGKKKKEKEKKKEREKKEKGKEGKEIMRSLSCILHGYFIIMMP